MLSAPYGQVSAMPRPPPVLACCQTPVFDAGSVMHSTLTVKPTGMTLTNFTDLASARSVISVLVTAYTAARAGVGHKPRGMQCRLSR